MPRTALAAVIAVFLLLAGLYNLGAGVAQFGKAELVSGTTSALASMGESLADANRNNGFAQGSSAALQRDAKGLRDMGSRSSMLMYLVAIGIVLTAVVQLAAGFGAFTRSAWAASALLAAGAAGVLVELQDIYEDGFGVGQIVFLAIAAGAIYLSRQMNRPAAAVAQANTGVPS